MTQDRGARRSARKAWTREQALQLCELLSPSLEEAGWGVALAGSVLYRGHSDNDLDLVVFPLCVMPPDPDPVQQALLALAQKEAVRRVLSALSWRQLVSQPDVMAHWRAKGSSDTKHVEVWSIPEGKRVDLFFLS